MYNFALKIAYDGSVFCGWQIQPNGVSVQQCIQNALKIICKQDIKVIGSGRTDSKVHALAQYASISIPINISCQSLVTAITTKLNPAIKIVNAYKVTNNFNARYSAISRSYIFKVAKTKTPFNRLYKTYFVKRKINSEFIKKAMPLFLGEHDFTEFCKQNPDLAHNRCIIYDINWQENEDEYIMYIKANRFLHNMVRRILGTLVTCSSKNISTSYIKNLIELNSNDRRFVYTAPPNGLYLHKVDYPKNLFLS